MEFFGIGDDGFCPFRWNLIQDYVGKRRCVLGVEDGGQSFDDVLFVVGDVSSYFLFLVDGYSVFDAVDDVEEEGEAEGVEGQVPGCNGLSFNFVEFDRPCQEDELMADGVIAAHELVYLQPCFGSNGGVELHQMHVVFNKLEKKQ